MNKKFILFSILLILLSSITYSELNYENLTRIKKLDLCENVINREPVSIKNNFFLNEKAYLFSEVVNSEKDDFIYHVWYYKKGDSLFEMARIKLKVSGIRWRTWSNKKLSKEGNWEVHIENKDGNLLKKINFIVEGEN